MAQTDTSASSSTSTPSTPAANPAIPEVTVDEFCTRLSASDKRVELLSGFCFVEKKAGHFKDAESNYAARFQAYINKPV